MSQVWLDSGEGSCYQTSDLIAECMKVKLKKKQNGLILIDFLICEKSTGISNKINGTILHGLG